MADATYSVATIFEAVDLTSKIFDTMSRKSVDFGKKTTKAFKSATASGAAFKEGIFKRLNSIISKFINLKEVGKWTGEVLTRAFRQPQKHARNLFGTIFRGVTAANALRWAITKVKNVFREGVVQFIDFDRQMLLASNRFEAINLLTIKGMKEFVAYRKEVRRIGNESEFGAVQAARAWGMMGRAGLAPRVSIAALNSTIKLARSTGIKDLTTATDLATASLVSFGLNTGRQEKIIKNYNKIAAITAFILSRTKTSQQEMTTAIERGALTWRLAGQSVESFYALLIAMGRAGIPAEEMGTSIRNFENRIATAGKKGKFFLDKFGISIMDQNKNLRPMIKILGDIEIAFKKMGTQQRIAALNWLFGRRTVNAASAAIQEGSLGLAEFEKKIRSAPLVFDKMANIMESSIGVKLEKIKVAAIELGFKFLEAFSKDGKDGLDSFLVSLKKFDMKPIVEGAKKAIEIFKSFFDFLKEHRDIILSIAKAWVGLIVISKVITVFLALKSVAVVLSALFPILLSPVGLGALAIGILVKASVAIYENWDKISNIFKGIYTGKIGTFFRDIFTNEPLLGKPFEKERALGENPFQEIIAAQRQTVNFRGNIDITGAPPGTLVSAHTSGGPEISMSLLGENP